MIGATTLASAHTVLSAPIATPCPIPARSAASEQSG